MPRKLLIAVAATWLPILGLAALLFFPEKPSAAHPASTVVASPAEREVGDAKANVTSADYRFGTMDFEESQNHVFLIRNTGDATLHLKIAGGLPDTVQASLTENAIAAGASGRLGVTWQTPRQAGSFQQTVTLFTNDPANRTMEFTIRGDVATSLAIEPPVLDFGDVRPHVGGEASALIYSNTLSQFDVNEVTSTLPELQWTIEPADPASLASVSATCGYRIKAKVPQGTRNGKLKGSLNVDIQASDSASKSCEIPLAGRVLRRLAVYGEKVNFNGVVDLGATYVGSALTTRVLLKVRDEQTDLSVRKVDCHPSFLQVAILPGPDDRPGEYHMDITIPQSAVPGNHTNGNLGSIRIEFDHPRIPKLELQAFFSVTEKSPFYEPLYLESARK